VSDAASDLQAFLATHVPPAAAQQIRVDHADEDHVRLLVPLTPNRNHEQTAFGGSLASAAMLAGWGLIWLRARHLAPPPRLVIAHAEMRFVRPVDADFEATCSWPRPDAWQQAAAELERRDAARLSLRAQIRVPGAKLAAVHDGVYAMTSLYKVQQGAIR
jgi:thioesterase domain-containing protein